MLKGHKGTILVAGVLLAVSAWLPQVNAEISDVVLTIQASNGRSDGIVEITADQGSWDGSTFTWESTDPIEIVSDGVLLGTFSGELGINEGFQVSIGFAVQAADTDTQFVITSALVPAPLDDASGRADAAFTVLDFFGTGATLTGMGGAGGAYLAQYNGIVPTGSTFVEEIDQIVVNPGESLAVGAFEYPGGGAYTPIGDISDISAQIAFSLTAFGFASGSSNFQVVPEPAGLGLLVLAGLLVTRRR